MKQSIIIALTILSLLASRDAHAQDSLGIQRLGGTLDYWSHVREVVAVEDVVFIAGSKRLRIVDHDANVILGQIVMDAIPADRLYRAGDYLRVQGMLNLSPAITTISIEQPEIIVSQMILEDRPGISCWVNTESLSVIAHPLEEGQRNGLTFIDFSDPEHPEELVTIDTFLTINSISLSENSLFVLTAASNLSVFNIENPAQPAALASVRLENHYSNIEVQDTLGAFCPDRGSILHLFDLSDIQSPELIGNFQDPDREDIGQTKFAGQFLYYIDRDYPYLPFVGQIRPHLTLLDVSHPAEPGIAWRSEWGGFGMPYLDGPLVTVPFSSGFATFVREQPDDLQLANYILSSGYVANLEFDRDRGRLYLLEGGHREIVRHGYAENPLYPKFRIFNETEDLPHLATERIIHELDEDYVGQFSDFCVRDTIMYMVSGHGLVYNLAAPDQIALTDLLFPPPPGDPYTAVVWQDTLLYLASSTLVSSYSLGNPAQPQLLTHLEVESGEPVFWLHSVGDQLLVQVEAGYRVIDVSDPGNMRDQGAVELENRGIFAVADTLLYRITIQGSPSSFQVYSIADPTEPGLLNELEIEGVGEGCTVENGFVAIEIRNGVDRLSDHSLMILNVQDPENIEITGYYQSYRDLGELAFGTRRLYVSEFERIGTYSIAGALGENIAPVFRNNLDSITVSENQRVEFDVHAVDLNGDEVTIRVVDNLPPGAEVIDHGDGSATFSWQTDFTSGGEYAPLFVVSDGELTDTTIVAITVLNLNRPPLVEPLGLIEPPHRSPITEEQEIRFLWHSTVDPDSEQLSYTLVLQGPLNRMNYQTRQDTVWTLRMVNLLNLMRGDSLTWKILATDGIDTVASNSTFTLLPPLKAGDGDLAPVAFSLFPPYPNPFNSSVTITFSEGITPSIEGRRGGLSLCIYDLSGRLVADLTYSAFRNPHSPFGRVVWDAGGHSAGVYLVRLEEEGKSVTRKVVLMR